MTENDRKNLSYFLEHTFDMYDPSEALLEELFSVINDFIDEKVEFCSVCDRAFLRTEEALEYENADGEPACDCQSPENQYMEYDDE